MSNCATEFGILHRTCCGLSLCCFWWNLYSSPIFDTKFCSICVYPISILGICQFFFPAICSQHAELFFKFLGQIRKQGIHWTLLKSNDHVIQYLQWYHPWAIWWSDIYCIHVIQQYSWNISEMSHIYDQVTEISLSYHFMKFGSSHVPVQLAHIPG